MEIDPPFKENLATAKDWRKALNRVVSAGVVLRITTCRVSYATGFVVDKHHPTRCHRPEQEIAQSRGSRNESITPSLRLLTAIVSLTKCWFATSGCPTLSCCVYRSQGRNSRLVLYSQHITEMARYSVALDSGNTDEVGGSGCLLLLCMVFMSLSIMSMLIFACADDPSTPSRKGGGNGCMYLTCGTTGCGGGGGGGCSGGGCGGGH
ncbi:hypothetical protein F0562_010658 [Nyssa sinensis]|uniref:Uncharacterized protein n=1 Tax=Nyssa sinensis TaxID=561372 RepID=A0A5J4ZZH6_9ASTE|nr:hypothetical protein F0562_010658 [Nyssa sinensis]